MNSVSGSGLLGDLLGQTFISGLIGGCGGSGGGTTVQGTSQGYLQSHLAQINGTSAQLLGLQNAYPPQALAYMQMNVPIFQPPTEEQLEEEWWDIRRRLEAVFAEARLTDA